MKNTYYVYLRTETVQQTFKVTGCEAAFNAYKAAEAFVEALGLDAVVDLVDGATAEVLASTYDFGDQAKA